MSFTIEFTENADFQIIRMSDPDKKTIVEILPEHGALLHQFIVTTEAGSINIIDNYPDLETLNAEIGLSYKSCKASPFVCRIPEGKYQWGGVSYEIKNKFVDGSAIHGLISNKKFKQSDAGCNDDEAFVTLKYHYKKEDEGYPFEFICEVRYALKKGAVLEINTRVTNLDNIDIPVADGWHPYFNLGSKVDECLLQFNADTIIEFDEALIPTGNLLPDNRFTQGAIIGDTFIDNCFPLRSTQGIACTLTQPALKRKLSVFVDNGYPYLQLYTPPHRNSIAIENLSAAPDCYNNGMGLTILEPSHTFSATAWFKFEELL